MDGLYGDWDAVDVSSASPQFRGYVDAVSPLSAIKPAPFWKTQSGGPLGFFMASSRRTPIVMRVFDQLCDALFST
jgi:hypothetical protein